MAPTPRSPTGAQQLATVQAVARSIDIDILSQLHDPSILIFTPVNDSSYIPRRLLVGSTAISKTCAALLLVDDATDILYFNENMRSNTIAPLTNTHGVILRKANFFPLTIFQKAQKSRPWDRQKAAWSLGLFAQHEFLRAGEQGKVFSDVVVSDLRHIETMWAMLAEGSKFEIGLTGSDEDADKDSARSSGRTS
jgi:hypothetical protein